jgi:LDH2 family malate/lactate/ureidoglycolate dehydrogenase
MLGMLGGVLTGAAFGDDVAPHEPPDPARPFNQGHFILALDIRRFMPIEQFAARAEAFIDEIKATPLADGATEIFVPGEQSYRRWRARLQSGIPLRAAVARTLRELGESCGVRFDADAPDRPSGGERVFDYDPPTA